MRANKNKGTTKTTTTMVRMVSPAWLGGALGGGCGGAGGAHGGEGGGGGGEGEGGGEGGGGEGGGGEGGGGEGGGGDGAGDGGGDGGGGNGGGAGGGGDGGGCEMQHVLHWHPVVPSAFGSSASCSQVSSERKSPQVVPVWASPHGMSHPVKPAVEMLDMGSAVEGEPDAVSREQSKVWFERNEHGPQTQLAFRGLKKVIRA